jgi:hypothetical protein
MAMSDLIWMLTAFLLTLLVFSYIFGDNPLFRLVLYIFAGVSSAYLLVIVFYQVILPRLVWPFFEGTVPARLMTLVPVLLSFLLLTKLSPKLSRLGNISVAYLVGMGAAVAIGGAVLGTIITQTGATINLFDLGLASPAVSQFTRFLEGILFAISTITVLAYFHFGAKSQENQTPRRPFWLEALAAVGKGFIAVTLGALFANVYLAALAALVDRLDFIRNVIQTLLNL